ncbi:hypothetical protein [Sodalis ligni]|uniref:Biofilm development protein YmgB/AriR n=1 Tax=Sodalis ligni TaxID=2697027 RepID=A0A4R1N9T0_9GAMM|nr:hypothetical protein [Sodalis ligni]TCL02281.1 hypothetical protein EZJ58_0283 [Sodalis ligni]
MGIPGQALQNTHETLSQIIGKGIMELHRQGVDIQLGNLLAYLTGEQEKESDEARRFFIDLAIGLLSI